MITTTLWPLFCVTRAAPEVCACSCVCCAPRSPTSHATHGSTHPQHPSLSAPHTAVPGWESFTPGLVSEAKIVNVTANSQHQENSLFYWVWRYCKISDVSAHHAGVYLASGVETKERIIVGNMLWLAGTATVTRWRAVELPSCPPALPRPHRGCRTAGLAVNQGTTRGGGGHTISKAEDA